MNFLNTIPGSDIRVSALGLGTVKIGRDQAVKYPDPFTIPDDQQLQYLFSTAKESGINLIDTAPAYGASEDRIGQVLSHRQDWVICTKVGEEFSAGASTYNYSAAHTRHSVERSLKRLKTDYLDIVLIHSDGNDMKILEESDCLETLKRLQSEGKIRALGMSTKTTEGGILAASLMDIVMITYNLQHQEKAVLDYAQQNNCGIFVKKGLMSGHLSKSDENPVQSSMELVFNNTGVHSMIVGTINPEHLKQNVAVAKAVLGSSG